MPSPSRTSLLGVLVVPDLSSTLPIADNIVMSTGQLDNSMLAHAQDVVDIPASPEDSDEESSTMMSLRDLVAALQELEHQVKILSNRFDHRTYKDAKASPSRTAHTNSSVALGSNDISYNSPVVSDVPFSHSELNKDVTEFGALFGSKGTGEDEDAPKNHGAIRGRTTTEMRTPLLPKPVQTPDRERDSLGSDSIHCGDASSATGLDMYNSYSDPFACAMYDSAQLALFSGFLRSPFTPAVSPPEDTKGINPFDVQPHDGRCDCKRCFAMGVALSRDFKELSPLEPWVAASHTDDSKEGKGWPRGRKNGEKNW